jgi:hypothetical protein
MLENTYVRGGIPVSKRSPSKKDTPSRGPKSPLMRWTAPPAPPLAGPVVGKPELHVRSFHWGTRGPSADRGAAPAAWCFQPLLPSHPGGRMLSLCGHNGERHEQGRSRQSPPCPADRGRRSKRDLYSVTYATCSFFFRVVLGWWAFSQRTTCGPDSDYASDTATESVSTGNERLRMALHLSPQ